jgi:hypothetical protein
MRFTQTLLGWLDGHCLSLLSYWRSHRTDGFPVYGEPKVFHFGWLPSSSDYYETS